MSAPHPRRPSCLAVLRGVSIAMAAVAALFMTLATLAAGRTDIAAPNPAEQPAKYPVTADLLMVMKYYEGIPTTSTQKGKPPKLYATDPKPGQNPSLYANLATYYDDSLGNCTIGWGHLVYKRKTSCASRKGGWDLKTATNQLKTDISDKLRALNCESPTLSPGEIRAVTSFIYQAGASYLTDTTALKNRRGQVTGYRYCRGELARELNAPGANTVDVITNFISSVRVGRKVGRKKQQRKFIDLYPTWAKEEIWDATDGEKCCHRDVAYSIQTAIWPQAAVGTITITPTGDRDKLSGVTPPTKPRICATTATKKPTPARCAVSITSTRKSTSKRPRSVGVQNSSTGRLSTTVPPSMGPPSRPVRRPGPKRRVQWCRISWCARSQSSRRAACRLLALRVVPRPTTTSGIVRRPRQPRLGVRLETGPAFGGHYRMSSWLDDAAAGLASGALSRREVLRRGGVLAVTTLVSSLPGAGSTR